MNSAKALEQEPQEIRVQGNWKRRNGVATRYELALAIDRLIDAGKVEVFEGRLRLGSGKWSRPESVTPQERWDRQDEELRAFCQTMDVNETANARVPESMEIQSTQFEASVSRSEPRRGTGKYILRELKRQPGGLDYEGLIDVIFVFGGLEEPKRVFRKPAGKARR